MSRLSIKEIAYLLGYSQPSAFYIAFGRYLETAPGDYRAQYCTNSELPLPATEFRS